MSVVWAVLFVLVLIAGWVLTLFSLPGNWLMLAAAVVYAYFMPDDRRVDVGWFAVGVLLVLAVLGEVLEFLAGALGAVKVGGSKRAAVLALAGSVAGGIVGVLVGSPVPVVGNVVAALAFACVGALAGAMLGEYWKGRTLDESLQVGVSAFWGRLLGTLGKILVGSTMVVVATAALMLR